MSCKNCNSCPKGKKFDPINEKAQFTLALAGNPNTGKSTLFNALTGLRQHTGNWPGKTVTSLEGFFTFEGNSFRIVDLPGTYSLLSTSPDEQVARDFILFERPAVTLVVLDATRLERNLNLLLQIRAITSRVVVAINLMDEALRHKISIDARQLARDLECPVFPISAREETGITELLETVREMAINPDFPLGKILELPEPLSVKKTINAFEKSITSAFPELPNTRWIALRLISGDSSIYSAFQQNHWGNNAINQQILDSAQEIRKSLPKDPHESLVESIYERAAEIGRRCVSSQENPGVKSFESRLDRILTSRRWGYLSMILLLTLVLWLTIEGANYPSQLLASILVDFGTEKLHILAEFLQFPAWISGLLIDGIYLATAWVISVMLPPMAIFFPIFTLLEDFGYLPRVAFNLDSLFRRAGAHGKQALSLAMGFGCNAAGVVSTRIIDSPRERLIAIITNNFSLCNGRWPTQFIIASIFIGAVVPQPWSMLAATGAVTAIALLGIFSALVTSWALSRTVLRGEISTFHLELPPYRPPRFWRTLATSFIDRTLIVLWRAIVFAAPAGAVIWLVSNISIGNLPIAAWCVNSLDPIAVLFGLNGIIFLAYIVAIPANEIVLPSILMFTALLTGVGLDHAAGAGVMFEIDSPETLAEILKTAGWTTLTAVNLMIFSLLHNPCSTTIYSIYKETHSFKWTTLATILPLIMGLAATFLITWIFG